MKVLVVPFNYKNAYFPSAGVFVEEQINATRALGCQTKVLNVVAVPIPIIIQSGFRNLGFRKSTINDIEVISFLFPAIPKLSKLTHKLRLWIQKKLARKILKRWIPDITHVHMFSGGDVAQAIEKEYGVPYVVTEHLSGFAEQRYDAFQMWQASTCYNRASCRIAVSSHLAQTLKEEFGCSFNVVPNCIDTGFFKPLTPFSIKPLKKLVTVGRLVEIKNHTGLINAFLESGLSDDVTLTIIGEGAMKPRLEELILANDQGHRINLVGQLNKDELRLALSEHDAFVLSSHYETFGVVLVEAMSMGLPVLSTPCLGASEIITRDDVGMICEQGGDSLSTSLTQFIAKPFLPSVIRQHAIDHFSSAAVGKTIVQLYESVLETKRG